MANLLYDPGETPNRGRTNGQVIQGGLYGFLLRRKVNPRDPKTAAQQLDRNVVEYVGRSWLDVSPTCRAAWDALSVSGVDGFQVFFQYNYQPVKDGDPITLCPAPGYSTLLFLQVTMGSNLDAGITLGALTSNTWDVAYGDGNTENSGAQPIWDFVHTYAAPGTYDFYINVLDAAQASYVSATDTGITDPYVSRVTGINGFFFELSLRNQLLPTADVNFALQHLDGTGITGGTVTLDGQTPAAPPTGAGITAAANLVTKGWTVVTD